MGRIPLGRHTKASTAASAHSERDPCITGSHPEILKHYSTTGLLARLEAALLDDGADPAHPTLLALAPYDHFHGRGLEATEDMAAFHPIRPTDHLLDVGSGLGGPAR